MMNLNKEDQDFHLQHHFLHNKTSAELLALLIWKKKMIQTWQVF